MVHQFELHGINCWITPVGDVGSTEDRLVIVFPGEKDMTQMLPGIVRQLQDVIAAGQCRPFTLVGFESENWERDFTPWQAPRLFKRSPAFGGEARKTLAWMENAFLPAAMEKCGAGVNEWRDARRTALGIMGYSLGGLFALWVFCESTLFKSCAACSGSLWYDDWATYMASHHPPQGSRLYLSLGKNEEHTKNPRMATVGDITRKAAELYGKSRYTTDVTLQWHDGGHFDDVPSRLKHALLWLARS